MRLRLFFILAIVLTLAAGGVLGRLSTRLPPDWGGHPPHNWLVEQLNLSSEQRNAIDDLWNSAHEKLDANFQQRRELDHQREKTLQSMLTDSQRLAYEALQDEYHKHRQQLDDQRRQLLDSADQRSRDLLDDSQKAKWDALVSRHERHGSWGGSTRPSTRAD